MGKWGYNTIYNWQGPTLYQKLLFTLALLLMAHNSITQPSRRSNLCLVYTQWFCHNWPANTNMHTYIYIYVLIYIYIYVYKKCVYIWAIYYKSLTWIKGILGGIPLLNHNLRWPRLCEYVTSPKSGIIPILTFGYVSLQKSHKPLPDPRGEMWNKTPYSQIQNPCCRIRCYTTNNTI